ncbi:MAG: FGGY family carbohydrate kinase [Rhodobacterales bacterium]|nr:FGGY family carbohydrate kinase [Rhodobacterales bacterium]
MRIAAIDQGTTSTRALTVDASGAIYVVHSVEHKQYYPNSGWVDHDPEELVRNIIACAKALPDVAAIGIDNQGESCLAWDSETKLPLSNVIVWQDRRTTGIIETLKKRGSENLTLARAGLPLDPYFSAAKLGWILENLPAAQDAHKRGTLRLGATDAFFLDRLTGHFVTDASTASRTSLMNLDTLEWDADLCALFGVPMETLPEITPTTGDFGTLETAHGPRPITASVVDQQAALYGFGCRDAGDVKITFGTGAFALMVTGNTPHRAPQQGLLPTVAWQIAGDPPVYALDGGVYTASAALNWAKSLGLFADFADIGGFDGPSAMERGLAFVPALSGLGCPHWDARARGVWLGLSIDHGPRDMVQSILEGIAFRAAQTIAAMGGIAAQTGPIPIDGGMSRNPYFVQFLADILGREVRRATMPEVTGYGTAMLAAQGAGLVLPALAGFQPFAAKTAPDGAQARFEAACEISQQWKLPNR